MVISKTSYLAIALFAVGLMAIALDAWSRSPGNISHELPAHTRISAPGRIEGSGEPSRLRLPVTGQVVDLAVTEGQFVEAGQLLMRIDHQRYLREYERAQAELAAAEGRQRLLLHGTRQQEQSHAQALLDAQSAELRQAEADFDRVRDLRYREVATQQEFDTRRWQLQVLSARVAAAKAHVDLLQAPPRDDEVQVARAQVDAARANLALAKFAMDQTRLTSPAVGQILRINVGLGELAGPQSHEPAIVLADSRQFSVRAFVDEVDAPHVAVGMPARVEIDGLARHVKGSVTRVSPAIGPKPLWTGQPGERFDSDVREIWLAVEDASDLVLGLRVEVVIDLLDSRPADTQACPPEFTATAIDGSIQR